MANKVNLTLRIEPELRDQASELFQALGLDLSTATGLFYRQALRCNGLPFEVKLDGPVQPAEEAQAVPPGEEKSPAARTKAKKMAAAMLKDGMEPDKVKKYSELSGEQWDELLKR